MKFELRSIEEVDHRWLLDLHNDPSVLINLTDPRPITLESHMSWWERTRKSAIQERFIFTIDGVNAGFTKFYNIDHANKNCVLGADLHRNFRGKKLSHHMWELMLKHCFDDLKLHRVSLTTAEYNAPARKLYDKLGFEIEGVVRDSLLRNDRYHDQIAMYMLEDRYRINRSEQG